jgi:hypothetical protein
MVLDRRSERDNETADGHRACFSKR